MKSRLLLPALSLVFLILTAQDYERGRQAANDGNFAEAIRQWLPLAQSGDPQAQRSLGRMYARGDGVKKDFKEARQWFQLAAEQGDSQAQFLLGMMYEKGDGVTKDKNEAANWYFKAAQSNYAGAKDALKRVGPPKLKIEVAARQEQLKPDAASGEAKQNSAEWTVRDEPPPAAIAEPQREDAIAPEVAKVIPESAADSQEADVRPPEEVSNIEAPTNEAADMPVPEYQPEEMFPEVGAAMPAAIAAGSEDPLTCLPIVLGAMSPSSAERAAASSVGALSGAVPGPTSCLRLLEVAFLGK